jgi:hypothetical protein
MSKARRHALKRTGFKRAAFRGHVCNREMLKRDVLKGHVLKGHALKGHALKGHASKGHALTLSRHAMPGCTADIATSAPASRRLDRTNFTACESRARAAQPSYPSRPLHVREDACAPLHRGGCAEIIISSGKTKEKYFCGGGLNMLMAMHGQGPAYRHRSARQFRRRLDARHRVLTRRGVARRLLMSTRRLLAKVTSDPAAAGPRSCPHRACSLRDDR